MAKYKGVQPLLGVLVPLVVVLKRGCDLVRGSKVKICDCGVKLRWYFCGSGDLVIF